MRKATMGNTVASARHFIRYTDVFIEYVLVVDKKTGNPILYIRFLDVLMHIMVWSRLMLERCYLYIG